MKSSHNKRRVHLESVIRKRYLRQLREARRKKIKTYRSKKKRNQFKEFYLIKERRNRFIRTFYHAKYHGKTKIIAVSGDFGLEDEANIDYFLSKSMEFIDFNASMLIIQLSDCTRMWPSAITLFCSLKEWIELAARQPKPQIGSTSPVDKRVNSYLEHSGFYEYVNRMKVEDFSDYYSESEIVKIRREKDVENLEIRENEIIDLLEKYSYLTPDQIELFNDVILTEIFNNVTEHGISHRDKGYWLIAQYHPTHKFISLCIADNGIGIRNSLMTGPQANHISKMVTDLPENEGEFIKLAFEENISGAFLASLPKKNILGGSNLNIGGASRGNGLKRIRQTCDELNIPFSILSQYGYIFIDETGEIVRCGAKIKRVFAGTLFHLRIKAREA